MLNGAFVNAQAASFAKRLRREAKTIRRHKCDGRLQLSACAATPDRSRCRSVGSILIEFAGRKTRPER